MHKKETQIRCSGCERILRRCLCQFRPAENPDSDRMQNRQFFRLYVIQSTQERDHYKNSSTFIKFLVKDYHKILITLPSHHVESPIKFKAWQEINDLIEVKLQSDQSKILLYPKSEQAAKDLSKSTSDLSTMNSEEGKRLDLVLLDMTWGHSKRLLAHCPFLQQLSRSDLLLDTISTAQTTLYSLTKDVIKLNYDQIRSGKRKLTEINSFESVVYTLINNRLMSSKSIWPVWIEYQRWLQHLNNERGL